jgi:uncharacterized peroxidase-related enzyme
MTYIKTIADDEAEGTVAKIYEQGRKAGGVYATARLLSTWPELMAMEERRYQTVMLNETALSRAEKEMIGTAISVKNRCTYCCKHHMAMMIEADVDADAAQAIRDDYTTAPIDDKTRAMLDYVTTDRADQATEADVDRLRTLGWSDRQILEMIIVAGFFHDYNMRVSIFGLELEDWAKVA